MIAITENSPIERLNRKSLNMENLQSCYLICDSTVPYNKCGLNTPVHLKTETPREPLFLWSRNLD
jgi:hypothetical protein